MNEIALNTINIFAVIIGVISIGIIIHEKQENPNPEHTNSKKKTLYIITALIFIICMIASK